MLSLREKPTVPLTLGQTSLSHSTLHVEVRTKHIIVAIKYKIASIRLSISLKLPSILLYQMHLIFDMHVHAQMHAGSLAIGVKPKGSVQARKEDTKGM